MKNFYIFNYILFKVSIRLLVLHILIRHARFLCVIPYPANSELELDLKVGDVVVVHKMSSDGWCRGTQLSTGRTGYFPASFVKSCQ